MSNLTHHEDTLLLTPSSNQIQNKKLCTPPVGIAPMGNNTLPKRRKLTFWAPQIKTHMEETSYPEPEILQSKSQIVERRDILENANRCSGFKLKKQRTKDDNPRLISEMTRLNSYKLWSTVFKMYEPRASLRESEPVNESENVVHMQIKDNDNHLIGAPKKMTNYITQNKTYFISTKHK